MMYAHDVYIRKYQNKRRKRKKEKLRKMRDWFFLLLFTLVLSERMSATLSQ